VTAITIAVFGLAGLLAWLLWGSLGSRTSIIGSTEDWEQRKLWVNVKSFALLIDREEESYLRRSLPTHVFLRIQRKRTELAADCAQRIGQNAALLWQLAQRAAHDPDPAAAAAARELSSTALRVRANAYLAVWCLRIKRVFPSFDILLPSRYLAHRRLEELKPGSRAFGQNPM